MNKIKITNWDTRQSFRADRGAPPWIKIYRNIMSNPKWLQLTDSEKGQIVSLWVVAADTEGELVNNSKLLMKMCQLDSEPNINKFIQLGFVTSDGAHCDANLTPTCQPLDAPEERQRRDRVEESREDSCPTKKEKQEAFDAFYSHYPLKKSKKLAIKAWDKLTPEEMQKAIDVVSGEDFQTHMRKQVRGKKDFRPHPSSWLNAGRWADELEQSFSTTNGDPF